MMEIIRNLYVNYEFLIKLVLVLRWQDSVVINISEEPVYICFNNVNNWEMVKIVEVLVVQKRNKIVNVVGGCLGGWVGGWIWLEVKANQFIVIQ